MGIGVLWWEEDAYEELVKELEPLWVKELPKFKTPGKLDRVWAHHLVRIEFASKDMAKKSESIKGTRPHGARIFRKFSDWCQMTFLINTMTGTVKAPEGEAAAKKLAQVQAMDQVCMTNAGLATVAAYMASVVDKKK